MGLLQSSLNNIEGVYTVIKQAIEERKSPSPQSSPRRGEEIGA